MKIESSDGETPAQDLPHIQAVSRPFSLDADDVKAIRAFLANCTTSDGVPVGLSDAGEIVSLQ